MSKITFSPDDIKKLKKNHNVAEASERSITYTDEFKFLFIEEYLKGKLPRIIFEDAGFDLEMIGVSRYEKAASRWIKSYRQNGILGLRDTRRENSGRPRDKELSQKEIIERQEAKIKMLEEQVELLKKLDKIERRLVNTRRRLAASDVFQLIHNTILKYNLKDMVFYFCEMCGVSRSGYYNYIASSETRRGQEENDLRSKDLILKAFHKHGYKKVLAL
jgi:hypothetical protein